ncbi:hypothetical protein V6N13_083483 [Hibiscus sabdariffa]
MTLKAKRTPNLKEKAFPTEVERAENEAVCLPRMVPDESLATVVVEAKPKVTSKPALVLTLIDKFSRGCQ